MNRTQFLSRGIDYLGDLGAKLRDLQGFTTLAHELIQNADDVPSATSMTFDVRDDSLVVDNDGIFTDCKQIEQSECPWKADKTKQHRCDFHRFRHIAGGDKRGEAGTTGAFGIGFIAVYQVTDYPELISAGRHWILHEDRSENERIEVCPGCPKCKRPDLPGTRFILPWARDPLSALRQALRAEPVSKNTQQHLLNELERSLPIAMLFLKHLRSIEIKRLSRTRRAFQRMDYENSLILTDGDPKNDRIWHIVHGGFPEAANTLRVRHPSRIEDKRSEQITLAIPAGDLRAGLLCAFLPTEQDTALPFHINADFFPTSDRKRVILAGDYQSEWNRAALTAAANALAKSLPQLPSILGARRFWALLAALKEVADKTEKENGELTFARFWKAVEPQLKISRIIPTTRGQWTTSTDSSLLLQKEETDAIPVLEALGVNVVHEELRPYQNLLRLEAVSVPLLDIQRLSAALAADGLTSRVGLEELPASIKTPIARKILWREIALLLERQQRNLKAKADDEKRLQPIAIAAGRDQALWPCREIFAADEATVALFDSLGMGIPFCSNHPDFAPLTILCRHFDVAAAVNSLSKNLDKLERAWKDGRLPLRHLFAWFGDRRNEILANRAIHQNLRRLRIFPTTGKLCTLDQLALSGNFDDHLGLAEFVDLSTFGGRREFLRDLGMLELDFRSYALSHLPSALGNASITADKRRDAVSLVAGKLGEIKDDPDVRQALSMTPMVECADGEFRKAHECYFQHEVVRECLGETVSFALLPRGHESAFRDLYEWLGVTHEPRFDDLVDRIQELTKKAYSAETARPIQKIIAHLGKRIEVDEEPAELEELRSAAWLPAKGKGDRWFRPNELYATYQAHLFETQALFLDVPANIQNTSRPFLDFLRVKPTPSASLVVKHLLHCAANGLPVNQDVYRFLNNEAADPALNALRDQACLSLGDKYLRPSQVFWGEHPFGRYRRRLGEELRAYGNLLRKIGVRDTPSHEDTLNVIREISDAFGKTNSALDDEARAVLMACWQFLERLFENDIVSEGQLSSLHKIKCVPDARRILNPPEWMFFENRAGLAAKFGDFLTNNVISRPLGAGMAMAAAGVQLLGAAVQVQLLECADPINDPEITGRILDRRNQLGRVLESQVHGSETEKALARLERIRYESTTSLLIQFSLSAFNRVQKSEPEHVPALFQRDEERLIVVRRDGLVSWPAVARELAIALFPDADPGQIAAGLKEVLTAKSAEEAANALDELGYARLDTSIRPPVDPNGISGQLGTDAPTSGGIYTEAPGGTGVTEEPPTPSPRDSTKQILGEGAPVPSPSPPGAISPQPPSSGEKKAPGKRTGKLRSYVVNGNEGPPEEQDPDVVERRTSTEEAGVEKVVAFEKAAGRFPKVMPPKHPGYDIESKDAAGNVRRYIEVKSVSGDWGLDGVEVTHTQFNTARERADMYWLYIVERANRDDAKIHRIHDPARRVTCYMFDDGWRGAAESNDGSE